MTDVTGLVIAVVAVVAIVGIRRAVAMPDEDPAGCARALARLDKAIRQERTARVAPPA